MADGKKPVAILCHTCRCVDLITSSPGVVLMEECYFPDNDRKFGRATVCDEYELKTDISSENL